MFHIYASNEHVRYWIQDIVFPPDVKITTDFDSWIVDRDTCRMSLIDINGEEITPELTDHVRMICDVSDLTLIFLLEFTSDEWCHRFDRTNVIFVLPGRLNWQLVQAEHTPTYQGFFFDMRNFYLPKTQWLDKLVPIEQRHLWFDALLGRKKWHRDIIHQRINHAENVVTYFGDVDDLDIRSRDQDQFIWPSEILPSPQGPIPFTMQQISVDGWTISLSMILPIDVYNQTRYSIVAETINDNNWSFFTEKIAKPILAKRVFLVSSGQYYLRNLREMGFKTFDSVIDESYDEEPDPGRRLERMLEQVAWLQTQDPVQIYRRLEPILEHNFSVLMDTDWEKRMTKGIERVIYRFMDQHHKYVSTKEV